MSSFQDRDDVELGMAGTMEAPGMRTKDTIPTEVVVGGDFMNGELNDFGQEIDEFLSKPSTRVFVAVLFLLLTVGVVTLVVVVSRHRGP